MNESGLNKHKYYFLPFADFLSQWKHCTDNKLALKTTHFRMFAHYMCVVFEICIHKLYQNSNWIFFSMIVFKVNTACGLTLHTTRGQLITTFSALTWSTQYNWTARLTNVWSSGTKRKSYQSSRKGYSTKERSHILGWQPNISHFISRTCSADTGSC